MDVKDKKPEDFMYDSSDSEWSEKSTSDYWKSLEKEVVEKLYGKKSLLSKIKDFVKKEK